MKLTIEEKKSYVRNKYYYSSLYKLACATGKLEEYYPYLNEIKIYAADDYLQKHPAKIKIDEIISILHELGKNTSELTESDYRQVLASHAEVLKWIPEEQWTYELVARACKSDKGLELFNDLPDIWKNCSALQVIIALAHPGLELGVYEGKNRSVKVLDFESFDEEYFNEAIKSNPYVFEGVPKSKVTRKLLMTYLGTLIKNNQEPKYFGQGNWSNVPEELLDDKIIQLAICQAVPYHIFNLPEEYQSKKLWDWVCHHECGSRYTLPLQLITLIPDEYLDEENALALCARHFHTITDLPERFQNDDFYLKLLDRVKQPTFLEVMDLSNMTADTFLNLLRGIPNNSFGCGLRFWEEKEAKKQATKAKLRNANTVREYARVGVNFYTVVPKEFVTKDLCDYHVRMTRETDGYPSKFFDEETVDAIMENSYGKLKDIPDEYKTDAFYDKYIANCKLSFKDIPKAKITKDVILHYIEEGKHVEFITSESSSALKLESGSPDTTIWDKDVIITLLDKCPDFHFSQSAQDETITGLLVDYYMAHPEKYPSLYSRLYMLGALNLENLEKLLTVLTPSAIASGIITNYISDEVAARLYELDPLTIIDLPESFRESVKNEVKKNNAEETIPCEDESNNNESTESTLDLEKEKEADILLFNSYQQLSIFDFIA